MNAENRVSSAALRENPPKKWRFDWSSEQGRVRILLLLAMLFGIALRVFNYWLRPPSLWQDESYWAVKTLTTEAIDAQIRPLGFMLVTQWATRLFGAAPQVFRILPFAGSLVSLLLAPFVATRLFRASWAQVLAVLLLATNAVAVEMTVEFKHYGTEVGVYVALLAALLWYRERRSLGSFWLLLGAAWLGFFFSITIIFCYPVLFAFLAWDAYRQRRFRQLLGVAAAALLCLATIITIYFTTWRGIHADKAEKKWGTWYDVFYLQGGKLTKFDSRPAWTAAKYFELASVPDVGRQLWRSSRLPPQTVERLKTADRVAWSLLHLAGLALLIRKRRWLELGMLWTPLLFVTAFNLAGRWPAGAFRTNTFYVPYAIFIAAMASEWCLELRSELARRWAGPCLAALMLLPAFYFRAGWFEKGLFGKPGAFTLALEQLPAPARKQRLLMDFASCRPWEYYSAYDQATLAERPRLRRQYTPVCKRGQRSLLAEFKRLAQTQPRGFATLITDDRKFNAIQRTAREACRHVEEHWVQGQTHLVVLCKNRE